MDNAEAPYRDHREETGRLTSEGTLSRNMVWNVLGLGLPTLIALAAIPVLIQLLGKERFGVLALAWLVFGYMSIFDLGLHRALTQLVSRALGERRPQDIAPLFWTALLLMFMTGAIGGTALGLLSWPLVHKWLKINQEFLSEAYWAFMVIALSMPLLVSMSALHGFIEAHQRFKLVFAVQMWRGVWTFAGPLLIAGLFTTNLTVVVLGLLLGRGVGWVLLMGMCLRVQPTLTRQVRPIASAVKPLLKYGGWILLAHTVVPIVLYGDRIFIGILISMEAVTYYITPSEIVVKLLLVPQALVGVLFPAFAATYRTDLAHTRRLFRLGLKLVYLSFLPVAILGVALSPEALRLWLDASFEQRSSVVLQLLIIGVFLNGTGILFSALVQGMGRPWISALVYSAELPIYGVLMWWLTQKFGIEGTAVAWAARQGVDALVLLLFSQALLKEQFAILTKQVPMAIAAVVALGILMSLEDLSLRLLLASIMVVTLALLGWTVMFTASERSKLKGLLVKGSEPNVSASREVKPGTQAAP